jgi:hypothetical protein
LKKVPAQAFLSSVVLQKQGRALSSQRCTKTCRLITRSNCSSNFGK